MYRLLVQTGFPTRYQFEMFPRISDVNLRAADAGRCQRAIEHLSRRSDEWFVGQVLLVAGLFADQHDPGSLRAFAEHGLGCVFPERAGAAARGLLAEDFEAAAGAA
jgi:hypothetical protein